MPETLLLGTRQFHRVDARQVIVEHDLWIKGEMAAARVHGLTMHAAETAEDFAARVVATAHESKRLLDLLCALLLPVEIAYEDWTPATVADVREHVRKLKAYELPDWQSFTVDSLIPFCEAGLISLWRSAIASSSPTSHDQSGVTPPPSASANGPGSSANSPAMISARLARSLAGHSGRP